MELGLQIGGFILALIGIVWGIFIWIDKKLEKRFQKIDAELKKIDDIDKEVKDIGSSLKSHIKHDLKYKVKHQWHDLKSKLENGEEISILEWKDARDLVKSAEKYKVNGETSPMQQFIIDGYEEALKSG